MCACVPALRPVLGRLYAKDPLVPKEYCPQEFGSKHMPAIKPRDYIQTPIRNSGAWVDLEGIAHDGLDYSINIKKLDDDENQKPRSMKSTRDLWSAGKDTSRGKRKNTLESVPSPVVEEKGMRKFVIRPISDIQMEPASSDVEKNKESDVSESIEVEKPVESRLSNLSELPAFPVLTLSNPSTRRGSFVEEQFAKRSSLRSSRRKKITSSLNSSNEFYFPNWPAGV
jgi:hypothetical protein